MTDEELSRCGAPRVSAPSDGATERAESGRIFGEFEGTIKIRDDFAAPLAGDELAEWER
jgi:hypothetical protein